MYGNHEQHGLSFQHQPRGLLFSNLTLLEYPRPKVRMVVQNTRSQGHSKVWRDTLCTAKGLDTKDKKSYAQLSRQEWHIRFFSSSKRILMCIFPSTLGKWQSLYSLWYWAVLDFTFTWGLLSIHAGLALYACIPSVASTSKVSLRETPHTQKKPINSLQGNLKCTGKQILQGVPSSSGRFADSVEEQVYYNHL